MFYLTNNELFCLTSDILGPEGDIDVEKLFNGKREALLVAHHGDVVEAVKVGQSLQKKNLSIISFKLFFFSFVIRILNHGRKVT